MSFLNSIFGGSDSKSGNNAFPWVQSNFGGGGASAFNSGIGGVQGLLGLGGGDPSALNKFWNSSGGNFLLNKGVNDINSNFYARGLGQSGAAMKSLEGYRSNLASTNFNNILQDYMGLGKLGLGAGSLVSDAGQFSKGSNSSGGLGSFLGAMLAFA